MSAAHTVGEDDDGIRLDRWFQRHFPHMPHALLQKHLRKKDIRLDGKKAAASDRVKTGQEIRIAPHLLESRPAAAPKKKAGGVSPEEAKKVRGWVLFESRQVIAVNKPAGLAVQGGSGQTKHLDAMLDALAEGGRRPKLVHRLDRDTSGVLLLAKNAGAADALMKAFAGKRAEKIYWALVKGVPEILQGEIDLPLAKGVYGNKEKMTVPPSAAAKPPLPPPASGGRSGGGKSTIPGFKEAVTRYRVLERLGRKLAWVELLPLTGRTHQLRVHMAAIGHPIIGDGKYGGREAFIEGMELPRQLHLHARRILVPDLPGGAIDVAAPLPPHMRASWKSLGLEEKDHA